MKKILFLIGLMCLMSPAYCIEEVDNGALNDTYRKDTDYLLEKVGTFKDLGLTQTNEPKEVVVQEDPRIVIPDAQTGEITEETKSTLYGSDFKLTTKFIRTETYDMLRNRLAFKDKRELDNYVSLVTECTKQFRFIGTDLALAKVIFVINPDGTVTKAKIHASTYVLSFNKQMLEQVKSTQFPPLPLDLQGLELEYQFDNIYK